MPEPAIDAYIEAFDARCAAAAGPGIRRVDEAAIRGVVDVDGTSGTQLLVLDDRAVDVLSALLPLASAGTVRVREAAVRCIALLHQHPAWTPKEVTAMVCGDLRAIPEPVLPDGLSLRPVHRGPDDPSDGVPLTEAVAAAVAAAPAGAVSPTGLLAHLRSLPRSARLFAAVDSDGAVRGTSGAQNFSADAYVFFVNAAPGWRRRGVGLSMTAVALRSAMGTGATRACLDASGAGVPLYERLGFTAAGGITQFSHVL
ncbi:MAG: GNAT family N-acetyltransferase [Motilibacteraceae bacterium]